MMTNCSSVNNDNQYDDDDMIKKKKIIQQYSNKMQNEQKCKQKGKYFMTLLTIYDAKLGMRRGVEREREAELKDAGRIFGCSDDKLSRNCIKIHIKINCYAEICNLK